MMTGENELGLTLDKPKPSARTMRAAIYLETVKALLPGDHIHYEANKVAPVAAQLGAIEAAQLKRMRKLQKAMIHVKPDPK